MDKHEQENQGGTKEDAIMHLRMPRRGRHSILSVKMRGKMSHFDILMIELNELEA